MHATYFLQFFNILISPLDLLVHLDLFFKVHIVPKLHFLSLTYGEQCARGFKLSLSFLWFIKVIGGYASSPFVFLILTYSKP
jgi:hypothetical protein